jgi:hypothetical protein
MLAWFRLLRQFLCAPLSAHRGRLGPQFGQNEAKWGARVHSQVADFITLSKEYDLIASRFYAEFPAEWRQNDTVNLLLGMLLLFNVEVVGLQSAISVTVENMKFQSLLKRWITVSHILSLF